MLEKESAKDTARRFRIDTDTIYSWKKKGI